MNSIIIDINTSNSHQEIKILDKCFQSQNNTIRISMLILIDLVYTKRVRCNLS